MASARRNPDALRDHTTPLETTDPESDLADSDFLDEAIEGAAIVGLGEATHGTREFARLKHRIVRFLVERGFRTVSFEADVAAMAVVDDYVRFGSGDPESALAAASRWQWRTQAVRELLAWLRSFNENRPLDDRVRVRGIDLSAPDAPATRLRTTLESVGPADVDGEQLVTLTASGVPTGAAERDTWLDDVSKSARSIRDRLDNHGSASLDEHEARVLGTARHLCRVVERTCEWHRVRHEHDGPHAAGMAERDHLMGKNVAWSAERDTGEGVVVWAHNSHVQRGTFDDGRVWSDAATLGERLDRRFSGRYVPLGFDFGRGSFRAVGANDGSDDPTVFSVGDPIDGSATSRLDTLNAAPCVVDLAAANDSRLEPWLENPQHLRCVGTVYEPDAPPGDHYQHTPLSASYDGLFFVERSTPSRPLDSGK